MHFGATDILVIAVAVVGAALLAFLPALRRSDGWAATATPLASIMGSGFLVSAPLLVSASGLLAPVAMAGLLVVAYAVGSVIRFNIRYAEAVVDGGSEDRSEHSSTTGHSRGTEGHWAAEDKTIATHVEQASHVILACAYVVSVTYYLSLLSSFVLDRFGVHDPVAEKIFTTAVLVAITVVGTWRGLHALEGVERYAVALNLGMIGALLTGLVLHHVRALADGTWHLPDVEPTDGPVVAVRHLMGLLIVVQGFETSRFLGGDHDPAQRARTMRLAQLVSAAIYLVFCSLALVLFSPGAPPEASVTEIVHLVSPLAVVLPLLIVVAAAGSQFSAAVADDAGCAGLLSTIFGGRIARRTPYLLIGLATIALTWSADVLVILSYASRAFAVFYSLQCVVGVLIAAARKDAEGRVRVMVLGTVLAVVTAAVAILGIPAAG